MFRRFPSAMLGSLVLLLGITQASVASTIVTVDGSFTDHLYTRSGIHPGTCAEDLINCGTGIIKDYGRATDAFYFDDDIGLAYELTLEDGSKLLMGLEFSSITTPGASGEAPGQLVGYGNPFYWSFDAFVVGGTGVFDGATGGGTVTLHYAGAIDQISVNLSVELP
jgi:hypothetical protein